MRRISQSLLGGTRLYSGLRMEEDTDDVGTHAPRYPYAYSTGGVHIPLSLLLFRRFSNYCRIRFATLEDFILEVQA